MKYKMSHMKSDDDFYQDLGWSGIVFHEEEKFVVPMLYPAKIG